MAPSTSGGCRPASTWGWRSRVCSPARNGIRSFGNASSSSANASRSKRVKHSRWMCLTWSNDMNRRVAALAIGIAVCSAQLKLSPTLLELSPALHGQAPPIPQGAVQPGPPVRAQMPPRDGAAEAPTGTARIRGRVVSADNGTPLRRALVRVSAGELRVNRVVTTDAEGHYEFAELPAGRYNIFVTRSGFVSLQFGQRRPFESGRPLDVPNAQLVEK